MRWVPLAAVLFSIALPLYAQDTAQPAPDQAQQRAAPPPVDTVPVESEDDETKEAPVTEGATQLETINVTAEKRVKAQRDIPGSVGAIRGEELERMKAQGMSDYLKVIPGVFFADQGEESSVPIIRGITTQLANGFTAQTTGIFLDEMPFADLFNPLSFPDVNPFDLERVEVLKGPQGTLFGAGALAGAVRYITHKPDFGVWETKLSETFFRTDGGQGISPTAAAAVNVPLFRDKLALRGVVLRHRDPGLYHMTDTDSTTGTTFRDDPGSNRSKQASERVLAAWDPLDDLKISGFYFGQRTHLDDMATADNPDTPTRNDSPFPSPHDHRFSGANLLASYDLGWATLTSSTNGMRKYNYLPDHQERGFNSLKHQNQNEFLNVLGGHVNGLTEELRLSSPEGGAASDWEWLGGVAYIRYNDAIWEYENAGPYAPAPTSPDDISETQRQTAVLFADIKADARESALFGEVTRKFADRWELTGGGRFYKTEAITDTLIQGAEINALFPGQNGSEVQFDQIAKGFNPKVSLRYLHSRNVQWYVLAAKGFQFGGIQLNPPAALFVTGAQQAGFNFGPYDSSKLWNYESGFRTEWLDKRLRFDVTFFYLDWSKLQETIRVPTTGGLTFGLTVNIGRAHSEGMETALEVLPFPGAKWTLAAGWTKAVTDVFLPTNGGDVPAGSRLPGAPRFQASNVVSYEHSLPYFTSWQFGPVVTHSHIGSSPDAIVPTGQIGGYDTLDARLTLSKPSSQYLPELSLGVNNITNVRGAAFHLRTAVADSTSGETFDDFHFIQPRTTMLSLTLNF